MNLTSTGLGMLGLRWPHYKGGSRDKWAVLARAGQRGRVGSMRSGRVEKGQCEVGARGCSPKALPLPLQTPRRPWDLRTALRCPFLGPLQGAQGALRTASGLAF